MGLPMCTFERTKSHLFHMKQSTSHTERSQDFEPLLQ